MQTSYMPTGLRNDWMMWLAIGFIAGAALFALLIGHPAEPDCQEDEAWIAVDYRALDGVEDSHGVTRACRNVDQLLDSYAEVLIQTGVLMYVPGQ